MKSLTLLGTITLLLLAPAANAATREVGPGKTYAKPCNAFAAAGTGDVVQIDASGNYDGDVCAVPADSLTIIGVNGRPRIDAAGANSQGKGTWVVQGDNVTIENIEFSGAAVPDHNGAAIRAEGNGLTIRSCYIHDNEEGILGGAGVVLIERTEFARNGNCIDPAGCAHNMYLSNSVTEFTLRYSYTHSVTDGHLVKSRAQKNYILSNRITGESGTNSYEIDLPNAGTAYIIGNLIEQGPNSGNSTIIAYGEEGATNTGKDLYVVNNTFVNDRNSGTFVNVAGSVTTAAVVKNNIFLGPGTAVNQSSAVIANNFTGNPMLVDRAGFDYHLLAGSPCIDAGADPGVGGGRSLVPTTEYVHVANSTGRATVGLLDIGAYEFGVGTDGGTGAGGAANGTGGVPSNGGTAGNGGSVASGGTSSTGGAATTGGASGNGGSAATGGGSGTGGAIGGVDASAGGTGNAPDGSAGASMGGSSGTAGGASGGTNGGNGGRSANGGAGATRGGNQGTSGGVNGSGATTGSAGGTTDGGLGVAAAGDEGGCGCRTAGRDRTSRLGLAALASALLLGRRRARGRRASADS